MFLFLFPYLESVQTVVLCRFWFQCSRSLRHMQIVGYFIQVPSMFEILLFEARPVCPTYEAWNVEHHEL
jgi:hypothetical protein